MTKDEKKNRAGTVGTLKGSWNRRGLWSDVVVPIGLEKLLVRAAGDEGLRDLVLRDRVAALERMNISLTDSEAGMLAAISDGMLEKLIGRFDLTPSRVKPFARRVTATVATGLLLSVNSACVAGGAPPHDVRDLEADTETDEGAEVGSDVDTNTDAAGDYE